METNIIKSGAKEVFKHFFVDNKGHLDQELNHVSTDEIRYNLHFKSDELSKEAKTFLEALLFKKAYVTIKDLHFDDIDGVSKEDIETLVNSEKLTEVEQAFKPLPEINVFEGSDDFGINTRNSVHDFEVFSTEDEKKFIYVARGRDGLAPTGFWIGTIGNNFDQEYISLEAKSINNGDFRGVDVFRHDDKISITILNRATSDININRVTNKLFQFNLGGKGQEEAYYIIVYDKEEEKDYYSDLPRKFFLHRSERIRYFNKDGRLIAIRLNNDRVPNRVMLPFSIEEVSFLEKDLKSLFLAKMLEHNVITDDGVMMGISSFHGASREQLQLFTLLAESDNRAIVTSERGVYIFGRSDNNQLMYFLDKKGTVSLVDLGISFSDNFGKQDARVIGASLYKDTFVLLVESLEREEGVTLRDYFFVGIKEESVFNEDVWNSLSPIKLITRPLSSEAALRGFSINEGVIYILSDDPSRTGQGKQEHIIHEVEKNLSENILGEL